jgi:hypothetical protein
MKTGRLKCAFRIIVVLACLLAPIQGFSQLFKVTFKDGTTVTVRHLFEKDGTVYIYRFGSYIGVEKSNIEEIKEIEDKEKLVDSGTKKNSVAAASNSPRPVGRQPVAPALSEEEIKLKKIEELESKIEPLREEAENACKGAAAIASGRAKMPSTNGRVTAEDVVGAANMAMNTAAYCAQKARAVKQMEKDLDTLKGVISEPEPEPEPEQEPASKENSKKSRRRFL